MKVVHINTYNSGGAFIAGYRFHREMLRQGVDSKFLVLKKTGKHNDVIEYISTTRPVRIKIYESIQYRILKICFKIIKVFIPKNAGFISLPFTPYNINRLPFIREADVIHLHFIANFISIRCISRLHKPIFWTFHDTSAFSGLEHYGDMTKSKINDLIKWYKLRLLKKINIICPSNWMYNEVRKSIRAFNSYCGVIQNGIQIKNTNAITKRIGSPVKIGFISASLTDLRKGVDFFFAITEKLSKLNVDVEIHVVGNGDVKNDLSLNFVHYHGTLRIDEMHRFYKKIDILLLLSRIDNLPNVMLEALSYKIPTIAFDVGGVSDMVVDRNYLITPYNIIMFVDKIWELVNNPEQLTHDKKRAHNLCQKNFDIQVQTKKYLKVYERESLLNVTNS